MLAAALLTLHVADEFVHPTLYRVCTVGLPAKLGHVSVNPSQPQQQSALTLGQRVVPKTRVPAAQARPDALDGQEIPHVLLALIVQDVPRKCQWPRWNRVTRAPGSPLTTSHEVNSFHAPSPTRLTRTTTLPSNTLPRYCRQCMPSRSIHTTPHPTPSHHPPLQTINA